MLLPRRSSRDWTHDFLKNEWLISSRLRLIGISGSVFYHLKSRYISKSVAAIWYQSFLFLCPFSRNTYLFLSFHMWSAIIDCKLSLQITDFRCSSSFILRIFIFLFLEVCKFCYNCIWCCYIHGFLLKKIFLPVKTVELLLSIVLMV